MLNLTERLSRSVSPYHGVEAGLEDLLGEGFCRLELKEEWKLKRGGRYVLAPYDAALIAFTVGKRDGALRGAVAHSDFPCLKLKPNSYLQEGRYGKCNIEVYGGAILNTWLDRPLSLAGKVVLRGSDPFCPEKRLFRSEGAVGIIPNIAIHLNRDVNKGLELNRQKDLMPLVDTGTEAEDKEYLLQIIARELETAPEEILSWDLNFIPDQQPVTAGLDQSLLIAPRLDNTTSVHGCIRGILSCGAEEGIRFIGIFDHEEVGSRSKQGAASALLPMVLERIYACLGQGREKLYRDLAEGFLLSADAAHAHHPNAMGAKGDPTNPVYLNQGVAVKTAAGQSYAGDGEAVAVVREICRREEIPYQMFVNRSDIPGGSTIGSILSAALSVRTMDVGVPVLAMHSAVETMGRKDQEALERLILSIL